VRLPLVDLGESPAESAAPEERHFTISYGDTGYAYESILGPYLAGANAVTIEDPYIRMPHQVANFVRFCETLVKVPTIRSIKLSTEQTDLAALRNKLEELKQSLLELDVALDIKLNARLHDREIRIDNGWIVKIGRGLDIYQKPDSWFAVVDIFRSHEAAC
jgi:ATP-dependent Lon protease